MGKGHQGTSIKDPWTKPNGGRIEGGRWGCLGWGVVVGRKWRQLYLNNNKKREREKIESIKKRLSVSLLWEYKINPAL